MRKDISSQDSGRWPCNDERIDDSAHCRSKDGGLVPNKALQGNLDAWADNYRVVPTLWGSQKVEWISHPETSQDIIINEILCNTGGITYPVRVPETEWLLHFGNRFESAFDDTEKSMFTRSSGVGFSSGRSLSRLSGGEAGSRGSVAPSNICDLPVEERPFRIQFAWSTSHMIYETQQGDHGGTVGRGFAILFRTTSGVKHRSGEGTGEVVFRTCTDYDDIPVYYHDRSRIEVLGHTPKGYIRTGRVFTLLELIQWADEEAGIQRQWPLPIPGYFRSVDDYQQWASYGRAKLGSPEAMWCRDTRWEVKDVDKFIDSNQNLDSLTLLRAINRYWKT